MLLLTFLTLVSQAGCSKADGPVRFAVAGKVTSDGTPLPSGLIRFVPKSENAGPGAMTNITDGTFQFTADTGPVEGDHRVEIESTNHQGFEIDDESAFAAAVQKTGKSPLARNPIPASYNTASTLTATVTDSEAQEFSFELKSRP